MAARGVLNTKLTFVHGWGFNASVWKAIISYLPDCDISTVDLGFIRGSDMGEPELARGTVIIGHSLGVLWSLKHLPECPAALISICGFDRFSPPVPGRNLEIMKRGLMKDHAAQLAYFWRSCGVSPVAEEAFLNRDGLSMGLDWLAQWDGRHELSELSCPVHALAAIDDEIVPEEMSRDTWGRNISAWSDGGGHGLPVTRPRWCAQQIRRVLKLDG